MVISKGLEYAYRTQDAVFEAIADIRSQPKPLPESKALALAELVNSLDRIQARIRIHRGKRPKRKPRATPPAIAVVSVQPAVASSSSVLGTPSTAKSEPDKTVPPSTHPGSRTDLPPTQPNS